MKIKLLEFVFGKNPGKRWKRMLILLLVVFGFLLMALNIKRCGYNEKEGPFFEWGPAANIEVKK